MLAILIQLLELLVLRDNLYAIISTRDVTRLTLTSSLAHSYERCHLALKPPSSVSLRPCACAACHRGHSPRYKPRLHRGRRSSVSPPHMSSYFSCTFLLFPDWQWFSESNALCETRVKGLKVFVIVKWTVLSYWKWLHIGAVSLACGSSM